MISWFFNVIIKRKIVYIKSKVYTYENMLRLIEELLVDIIPIEKEKNKSEVRHWDHLRPMNNEEEKFLYTLDAKIFDILKRID